MERRLVSILGMAAAMALLVGCLPDRPGEGDGTPRVRREAVPDWDDEWGDDGEVSNVPIENGYLAGDMGGVRDFEGAAVASNATQVGDWAYFNLTTTNPEEGYSVMAIIEMPGGTDNPGWVPGERYEFDGWEAGPVGMNVTGCSGPRQGSWVFDAPAEQVVVEVDEGSVPGNLLFSFQATFSGAGTTEGSFETGPVQSL